ncbi:MAG: hypothetical protein E7626_02530 [Ruminococcaceae bacterium]|nr:hypothetical protein [Oscillospiraceae bacterium]
MDFIEYKRFVTFFKNDYAKVTKLMITVGMIVAAVGIIPALLGFAKVPGFYDWRMLFIAIGVAGVVCWGMGSGRIVKDFEFEDVFYRVSRDMKEQCESKFGYADDLKNAVMFEGFVIDKDNAGVAKKLGNKNVSPLGRVCYVYARKEKFYVLSRTFSFTEEFVEDKEYDVHFSSISSAEYLTEKLGEDLDVIRILIKTADKTLLDAYISESNYDIEVFPENIIHKRDHIMSRM